MKVLLLHLSDIHFKEGSNKVMERIEKIPGAVQSSIDHGQIDLCIMACTGDVAFSGKKKEYQLASNFFDRLAEMIKHIPSIAELAEVYIPGNHDCDLSDKDKVREDLSTQFRSGLMSRTNLLHVTAYLSKQSFLLFSILGGTDGFNPLLPKNLRLEE